MWSPVSLWVMCSTRTSWPERHLLMSSSASVTTPRNTRQRSGIGGLPLPGLGLAAGLLRVEQPSRARRRLRERGPLLARRGLAGGPGDAAQQERVAGRDRFAPQLREPLARTRL